MTVKAPITETLASALIMLTPWRADRILVDPFCGSGTIPIEAAMIAAKMAPGVAAVLLQRWTLSARQETQEEEKVWGLTTSEMLRAQGRHLA